MNELQAAPIDVSTLLLSFVIQHGSDLNMNANVAFSSMWDDPKHI